MNSVPQPNETPAFTIGSIVRLAEYVGTKAQGALVWRVVSVPDPSAKRKAEREDFRVQPVGGGAFLLVPGVYLVPASPAEAARYEGGEVSAPLTLGEVVVGKEGTRAGTQFADRHVILSTASDGTVRIARLGGDGGKYFTKVRMADLVAVNVS